MYRKSSQGWLKHFDFILLDLICLHLAFTASYMVRHGAANPYGVSLYRNMAIAITFTDIAVMFFYETFKNVLKRGYFREFSITLKHALLVELFGVLYLFTMQNGSEYSRSTMYLMGIFYAVFTYAVRILWKKVLQKRMKQDGDRALLIVTTRDIAAQVVSNIKENNYERFHIAGVVLTDWDKTGDYIEGIPVVANIDNAADYVCSEWVDEIFINLSTSHELPQRLINQFIETGVTVHLNLTKAADTLGVKQLVEKVGNYTVLSTSINFMTAKQAFMKRTMDIAGGLAGCILTGLVFLVVAPMIYLQSPGPIFFAQTRIGKNGKKFEMYKFRSMYTDAEERKKELMKDNRMKDAFMFKMDFDPRVIGNKILPDGSRKTGVGDLIRRTSLDEFPQFWNVLKGDMSLVGTRPPTTEEFDLYEHHHHARLAAKPGITGMWQVSGRSDILDFEDVVKLDMKYISEWSVGLDVKILLKTVQVVLKGEGSM